MKRDDHPQVIDLRRYRKAAAEAKAAQSKAARRAPPAGSDRFLGSRRHSGLILAAVVLLMAVLWGLPALFQLAA